MYPHKYVNIWFQGWDRVYLDTFLKIYTSPWQHLVPEKTKKRENILEQSI